MCGSAEGPSPQQLENRAVWKHLAANVEIGDRYSLQPDGSWKLERTGEAATLQRGSLAAGYYAAGYYIVGTAKPTIRVKRVR